MNSDIQKTHDLVVSLKDTVLNYYKHNEDEISKKPEIVLSAVATLFADMFSVLSDERLDFYLGLMKELVRDFRKVNTLNDNTITQMELPLITDWKAVHE